MARDLAPRPLGIGLIEALVALAVLAFALVALLRLQSVMASGTERERLRLDALLAVQSRHERLRAGWPVEPASDAGGITIETEDAAGPAGLRRRRSVARWQVRPGAFEAVVLDTLMPADPDREAALSALTVLDRTPARLDASGAAWPVPRHALIPPGATPLGDGRSAWQPRPGEATVWLIDDRTGAVVARCGGLVAGGIGTAGPQVTDCVAVGGLIFSGVVRFATDTAQPGPAEVLDPPSAALPLTMVMRPAAPALTAPETDCAVDAPKAMPDAAANANANANANATASIPLPAGVVRYRCVVAGSGLPPRWSGRLEIVPNGWSIGTVDSLPPAPPVRRVCRYSVDQDQDGRISNAEHPALYLAVDGPLGDQNFLVVRAGASCPQGAPPLLWATTFGPPPTTVPHQPP
ncbi:type IV pilus modification PilV family protein [Leptothrix sp. BB-4]